MSEAFLRSLRNTYGETLCRLMEHDGRIVVLDADLYRSTMTVLVEQRFPLRFIEMGIAEQNMVAAAAGLAREGKIPFVNSFAVFATGRAYDQIRQAVALARLPVKIVGSSAGLSNFGDGATHQSVEDISLMRSLPTMTVLCPCDAAEVEQMLPLIIAHAGPVYLRLTRAELPVLDPGLELKDLTGVRRVREGGDAVIFATGAMVFKAMEAASILEGARISTRVVNVSTLKPFAEQAVCEEAEGMKAAVTAEEHSVIGGLGSAVASALRRSPVSLEMVGIRDCFGASGENMDTLMHYYGLTTTAIVQAVHDLLAPHSAISTRE
jgi:transketolase